MKRILAAVYGIISGVIGGYFISAIVCIIFDIDSEEGTVICFVICGLITAVAVYFIMGLIDRCDKCGKLFACYEISKEGVGGRETTMRVKKERRDIYGKFIDCIYETVPAVEILYACKSRCEYCGNVTEYMRSETQRK